MPRVARHAAGLEELLADLAQEPNPRRRRQLAAIAAGPLAAGDGHPPLRRGGAPAARGRTAGRAHGPRRLAAGRPPGRRCLAGRRPARPGPRSLPQAQVRGVAGSLPGVARHLPAPGRRPGGRPHAQQFAAKPDLPGPLPGSDGLRASRRAQIFERLGDRLRLARLDANMGNILYRQDRFEEALELYLRAYDAFLEIGEPQDIAISLKNTATCQISLNDFREALATYQKARAYCVLVQMPVLVAVADYNIAYLYYLRGEYTRSIELYRAAREDCRELGDAYREALCDLDQSEMYLELNLSEEGAHLAGRAQKAFLELGMGYEAAKAQTNLAISLTHHGDTGCGPGAFPPGAPALRSRKQSRVDRHHRSVPGAGLLPGPPSRRSASTVPAGARLLRAFAAVHQERAVPVAAGADSPGSRRDRGGAGRSAWRRWIAWSRPRHPRSVTRPGTCSA